MLPKKVANTSNQLVYLTVAQVADRWQVSRRQVYRLIESGELPVHRFGRSVRIAIKDLLIYEASKGTEVA